MTADLVRLVNLTWHGPYSVGTLPNKGFNEFTRAGLYIKAIVDRNERIALAYVGKATSQAKLMWRIQEHVMGHLSLLYDLYDPDGELVRTAGLYERVEALNDFESWTERCIDQTKRLRFFLAPHEQASALSDIECSIYDQMMSARDMGLIRDCLNKSRPRGNVEGLRVVHGFAGMAKILSPVLG